MLTLNPVSLLTAEDQQPPESDVWSEWLLHRRHADDPGVAQHVLAAVEEYADRVLDGAQLAKGMTLVDVGAGEGLLAFRAIDRIGSSLQAVLTDISLPMLRYATSVAEHKGVHEQCRFIEGTAEDLSAIKDSSVDVVATRSVLAYVADKPAALREFYRILKPGGRISIGEPILQDEALFTRVLRMRVDTQDQRPADPFLSLLHRWKSAQFPDTEKEFNSSPHVNYTERTLFKFVLDSGFVGGHLELHIDVKAALITSWDAFLHSSPHPWAPSLSTILAKQFSPEERQHFERVVRPGVESGDNVNTDRMVYITAVKPQ